MSGSASIASVERFGHERSLGMISDEKSFLGAFETIVSDIGVAPTALCLLPGIISSIAYFYCLFAYLLDTRRRGFGSADFENFYRNALGRWYSPLRITAFWSAFILICVLAAHHPKN
jgi:hypothetical protein